MTRSETAEPTAEVCAALAQRFDLRELSGLKAKLAIRRVAGNAAIRVNGSLEAEVVQACVVSLQDVYSKVEGNFDTYFTESRATGKELVFTTEDDLEAA